MRLHQACEEMREREEGEREGRKKKRRGGEGRRRQ
jgi:hypothetical protein